MVRHSDKVLSLASHVQTALTKCEREENEDDQRPREPALTADEYWERVSARFLEGPSEDQLRAARKTREAYVRKDVCSFGYSSWSLSINQIEIFFTKHLLVLSKEVGHKNICFEDAVKVLATLIDKNKNGEQNKVKKSVSIENEIGNLG